MGILKGGFQGENVQAIDEHEKSVERARNLPELKAHQRASKKHMIIPRKKLLQKGLLRNKKVLKLYPSHLSAPDSSVENLNPKRKKAKSNFNSNILTVSYEIYGTFRNLS